MMTNIFINLPVKDLNKSILFYEQLGYKINPTFTDQTAACIVISDAIYVMLLTHDKFLEFTSKKIANTASTTEVINSITVETKEMVNELFVRAINAGGKESRPAQDFGFMFARSFTDPDGHIWEVIWMDMKNFPKENE